MTRFDAGLPNIEGETGAGIEEGDADTFGWKGCFYNAGRGDGANHGHEDYRIGFDASRSNTIYGSSETVQPSAMTVNYFVRAR